MMIELSGKVGYAMSLEVEVVHVDVQTLAVVDIKLLLGVLQQEGGFPDAPRTLDADKAVAPVDLIHKGATNGCIRMLHEVSVRPKKSLHCLDLF